MHRLSMPTFISSSRAETACARDSRSKHSEIKNIYVRKGARIQCDVRAKKANLVGLNSYDRSKLMTRLVINNLSVHITFVLCFSIISRART